MNYIVYVAKTKALISFADWTAKLICAYVLAYAKSRFSHAAQLSINLLARIYHTAVDLMHTNKTKQGNKSDIVRGMGRKVLNIFKKNLNEN